MVLISPLVLNLRPSRDIQRNGEPSNVLPSLSFLSVRSKLGQMDELIHSYRAAAKYPRNLVDHHTYQHVLDSYVNQLNDKEDNLFCGPSNVLINFWQFDHESQGSSPEKCFASHRLES